MATDPNVSESVRLSAIKDALDRGGVSAKSAVEIEVGPPTPYEQILDGLAEIAGGSRAEFRRSRGDQNNSQMQPVLRCDPPELAVPIEAEVVEEPHEVVTETNRRTIRRRPT